MRTFRFCFLWAPALVFLAAAGADGDVIIFKDGFSLQGKITQENEPYKDPLSDNVVVLQKGFIMLDDVARRISFSHTELGSVNKNDPSNNLEIVKQDFRLGRQFAAQLPGILEMDEATPWDAKWERLVKLDAEDGRHQIKQRLQVLTPHYARVDAYHYNWTAFYLTSELGPDVVRHLLYDNPDLKVRGDKGDAARRFRVYRFLVQAGWYDQAEQQLEWILQAHPDEKEKVTQAREDIKHLRAVELADRIDQAHRAGQHRWVQEQLAAFPSQEDERLQANLRALKAMYETANQNLKNAQRLLTELPAQVPVQEQQAMLKEAADAILDEISLDDFLPDLNQDQFKRPEQIKLLRLDSFLSLALQAERDRSQGRTPINTPAQLLALAISGWLLGKDAADPRVDTALRLWQTRQFVLEYQRTPQPDARERMLRSYQMAKGQALSLEEMAQLIRFLPPPESEKDLGSQPREMTTNLPGSRGRGISYVVQLPPEYHPGRAYPLLLVLHHEGESPAVMLERFRPLAAQFGYLLAAPEWSALFSQTYTYSPEEHLTVLDVLRDLRRRFQVDSDRVFLTGYGEGANMAYDVGLAHPDLFAGVLPMAGQPLGFAQQYWPNAQYLPFYVVNGDRAGDASKANLQLFEKKWIQKKYPALHIEYRGRGQEWFGGELVNMFRWMDHKIRARAVPELGKDGNGGPLGEEFQTLRQIDNRFYWLSTTAVAANHINEAQHWHPRTLPATLTGRIPGGEDNQIIVSARGVKEVTVWIALDMRDRLDFEKPATITVNGRIVWLRRLLPVNLGTMLEDFYSRGDRQRLFAAKLDFDRW